MRYSVPGEEHYQAVLRPDDHDLSPAERQAFHSTVHEPFERLMAHWLPLNRALSEGRTPLSLLKQAAFVSAAMPDMSQPAQVRHYGHLLDMVNEGLDPAAPAPEHVAEFSRRAMGPEFPRWNRAYYELNTPSPGRVLNPDTDLPQIEGLRSIGDLQTKLSRMAHVHRDDGARQEWGDNGISRYALGLLGAGNAPVYDHQGKVTDEDHAKTDPMMADHPALAHVLDRYGHHFADRPDQALLPAVMLHRLAGPHHERMISGKGLGGDGTRAMLDDVAASYRKHGVHADDLTKGEYPASIHGRVLQALEETRQRHGAVASLLGFHLHGVPALLAADNGATLLKMEIVVEELKKNVEAVAAQQPKVVHFLGQAIVPGLARSNKGDYHILGADDTHYLAMPAQGENKLVRLPRAKENTHFQVLAPLQRVSKDTIDADAHGVAALNTTPEQRGLIHGADVTKWDRKAPGHVHAPDDLRKPFAPRWVRGGNKKSAVIKRQNNNRPGHVRNEAVFHNVARDVFGLGHYVPNTAVFEHPATGELHSIQESVPYAEHYNPKRPPPRQKRIMQAAADNGDLDKLALMDGIMGSSDRHPENYVLSRTGLHLIDNSQLFHQGWHTMPHYWEATHGPDGLRQDLHPEAVRWAMGLDANKLESDLRRYGVGRHGDRNVGMSHTFTAPVDIPAEAARRVRALQGLLHGTGGKVSRIKAYHSTLAPLDARRASAAAGEVP